VDEWMTDEEWAAELILFELLNSGVIETIGFDKDGEALIMPTSEFIRGLRQSLDWDDGGN
jgi:hypothetical protein